MIQPDRLPEVIDFLSDALGMVDNVGIHDPFKLKRWERAADRELESGMFKAEAWLLKAYIARLQRQPRIALAACANASRLAGGEPLIVLNSVFLMQTLGDFVLAEPLLWKFFDLAQGDKSLLRKGMVLAKISLQLRLSMKFAESIVRLGDPAVLVDVNYCPPAVNSMIEFSEAQGVDVEEWPLRLNCAAGALLERTQIYATSITHMLDGGAIYQLFVEEPLQRCAELDLELIRALRRRFKRSGADIIPFVCRPYSSYLEIAAEHRKA